MSYVHSNSVVAIRIADWLRLSSWEALVQFRSPIPISDRNKGIKKSSWCWQLNYTFIACSWQKFLTVLTVSKARPNQKWWGIYLLKVLLNLDERKFIHEKKIKWMIGHIILMKFLLQSKASDTSCSIEKKWLFLDGPITFQSINNKNGFIYSTIS